MVEVTPVLRVIRFALTKPDTPTKLPDGRIVGDERYKVVGFFDPDTEEGEAFIQRATALLGKAKDAREAVLFNLPRNEDLGRPIEGVPGSWRRMTAKTKYGPIETIDKTGRALDGDQAVYPGATVRLGVTLYPFDDQRQRGKKSVAYRLQTVLFLPGGEPLLRDKRVVATQVFASLIGLKTDVDPFADDSN